MKVRETIFEAEKDLRHVWLPFLNVIVVLFLVSGKKVFSDVLLMYLLENALNVMECKVKFFGEAWT